ncbi:MAG: ankyrin repeat domain-containing protein [Planctomycetes bacterium]|nr:ankyrin repeat domain-containing protein [Planctomycetota bacterium]NOG52820.1 ankyrin repeat domain-containing protein [Planctomycetota bacterium]
MMKRRTLKKAVILPLGLIVILAVWQVQRMKSAQTPQQGAQSATVPAVVAVNEWEAVQLGKTEALRYLLEDGGVNVNATNDLGSTLLLEASALAPAEMVEMLVDHGADLEAQFPTNGCTPLHWAVMSGRTVVVRTLLAHGADPLATDHEGLNPLQYLSVIPELDSPAIRKLLEEAQRNHQGDH